MEVEVRSRIQAGANAWRNVEEVIIDRNISRTQKGKVFDSCVVPVSTYGSDTVTLRLCENEICETKMRQDGMVFIHSTSAYIVHSTDNT